MSNKELVQQDERTEAVGNVGYSLALNFISFALLIDAMYRGLFRNEAAWDLLALVVISGAIAMTYQVRHKAHPLGWTKKGLYLYYFMVVITFVVIAIMYVTGLVH